MSRRVLFWIVFPAAAIVLVYIALTNLPRWHPQTRNLITVGNWIDHHEQQVAEFEQTENLKLKLYGFTGGDGTIGAQLTSATQEQFWRTRDLLHSLNPPRPIYWTLTLHKSDTKYPKTITLMERLSGENRTTTAAIESRIGDPRHTEP